MPPIKTKLTLSVGKDTLVEARGLARRSGRSISQLFAEFIDTRTNQGKAPAKWLESLEAKYPKGSRATRKNLRAGILKKRGSGTVEKT